MARYINTPKTSLKGINAELVKVQDAFEDVLDRRGDGANFLDTDLDMNSQRILNLPEPVYSQEPVRLGDVKAFIDDTQTAMDAAIEAAEEAQASASSAEQSAASAAKAKDTVQSFADAFALKIFQSPTDSGLTEIQTRTVNGGEVYEVRKTSDDSLATIYSDAAGTTEIVQNGTSNVSDSDGVVEFYVADGDYYVEVGGFSARFHVGFYAEYNCVEDIPASLPVGSRVTTRQYHSDQYGGGATYIISDTEPTEVGLVNFLLAAGKWAVFEPVNDLEIKVRQAGARFDAITDDVPSFNACIAAGFKILKLGAGVSSWGSRLVISAGTGIQILGLAAEKIVDIGGYQPHITQITPSFDSIEPLLDFDRCRTSTLKNVSFIAGDGNRNSYSGAAYRHYLGSSSLTKRVTSSGFKLGQVLAGHIYGDQEYCRSTGGQDGFSYEGVGGTSQTNICTASNCVVKGVHSGFFVGSCTAITLHACGGELVSGQYDSDRGTESGLIIDINNKNLSLTGTTYLEGADRFIVSSGTLPSDGTTIENFYYNNHKDYVLTGYLQQFGIPSKGTQINAGYIKNTDPYVSGTPSLVGMIRPKDDCTIKGVVGGWVYLDSGTDATSVTIQGNQFGIDKFKGVFYIGSDDTKRYKSDLATYYKKNTPYTTNASGYIEVDPELGEVPVGSMIIYAAVPQNTAGTILTTFEVGDGTFRVYARDSAGSLLSNASIRLNIQAKVVENF